MAFRKYTSARNVIDFVVVHGVCELNRKLNLLESWVYSHTVGLNGLLNSSCRLVVRIHFVPETPSTGE